MIVIPVLFSTSTSILLVKSQDKVMAVAVLSKSISPVIVDEPCMIMFVPVIPESTLIEFVSPAPEIVP